MTARRLAFALAALAAIAGAADAAEDQQVVYWPLVTDGTEYRRIAYPAEAGSLVVMAGTTVVLEARRARVSYWPITREHIAEVSRASPLVDGRVEIVAENGTATVVEPEPYLVWHPQGVGAGPAEVVRGDRAAEVYETYVRQGRAAAAAAQAYQRIVAEHHAAVEAWLKIAAQRPPDLPPPPPELDIAEPEPYRAFATEPENAALVTLPAGTYTLRVRGEDGTVVPGSERRLVSFAPRAEGVGYVIRPGDRWTQPVISFAPEQTIYTTGRSELFVQPVPVVEFHATHIARLFRPQSVEAVDPFLTVWIPRPIPGDAGSPGALAVWSGSESLGQLPFTPFRVAQLPNRSRGYEIEAFAPKPGASLEPDFSAMRIAADLPVDRIALLDGGAASGERRVRRVEPAPDAWLFLPALLPLAAGVGLRLSDRIRSARRRAARAAAG